MKSFLFSSLATFSSFVIINLGILLFYLLNGRRYTALELTDYTSVWIFGSLFILVGCLLGEGLFRFRVKPAKLYHFILLGLLYGGILYARFFYEPDYSSSSDIIFLSAVLLVSTVGSAVFYVFRRKAFN